MDLIVGLSQKTKFLHKVCVLKVFKICKAIQRTGNDTEDITSKYRTFIKHTTVSLEALEQELIL
jgi:hypothetical protein